MQRPSKVLLHNDDFTPVEVVIRVLVQEFALSGVRATWLTWKAHFAGTAVVGTWPRAEAELRVDRAHAVARALGWPLRLSVEDA
jgi:ATP-dependent Clp protease adaptor protein ClpS